MAMLIGTEVKRSFFTLLFDNGWKVILTREVFNELDLRKNENYDQEDLKKKIILYQYRPALNKAVSMLALRPCSKKEIKDRLIRFHYLPDTIDLVIYKLEKEGFLNDPDFAKQWVEARMNQGKYGLNRIVYELRKKGLPEGTIDEMTAKADPDQEYASALHLAQKNLKSVTDSEEYFKQKRRIYGMLARRGFQTDVIHRVMDDVFTEE